MADGHALISVLMAVRNAQQFLAEAIDSILAQTCHDFEFIIVDDGSGDATASIVQRYCALDSRVRFAPSPRRGLASALNEGLRLARGRYIAKMDADDVALPERFALQAAYLDEHPECVAVGGQIRLIDPDGEVICNWTNPLTHSDIDGQHLKGIGGGIVHPAAMMRSATMRAINGYEERINAGFDFDLFLRLAEHGSLGNLPDTVLLYRQHANSIGVMHAESRAEMRSEILRAAYRRRGIAAALPVIDARGEAEAVRDLHQKWAWWALNAGNVHVARKHARMMIREKPLAFKSWRVFFCTLRGS